LKQQNPRSGGEGSVSDKEKKRYFTIMIIPHNEESVLNLRIPMYFFQFLSIVLIGGLIAVFIWFNSLWKLQSDAAESSQLRTENRTLQEDIDQMAQETEELVEYVKHLEQLTMEVRQMVDLPVDEQQEHEVLTYLGDNEQGRILASRGGNPVIERNQANISHLHSFLPELSEDLFQLKEDVTDYKLEMAATPSIWPTQGRVTSEFGPRSAPFSGRREFHYGIDIAGPRGTPIYAVADGIIDLATYRRGLGNTVIIEHGYGYRTVYAHLSDFEVSEGQEIEEGELIGSMGSTGFSTGPHLHYEVHVDGVAVEPRDYLP